MMVVWLSAQNLDFSLHLGNLLEGFINLGSVKEVDKYGCDGRVACYLVFVEIRHHLMTMECGPHHYSGLLYNGITQIVPPHNTILI